MQGIGDKNCQDDEPVYLVRFLARLVKIMQGCIDKNYQILTCISIRFLARLVKIMQGIGDKNCQDDEPVYLVRFLARLVKIMQGCIDKNYQDS